MTNEEYKKSNKGLTVLLVIIGIIIAILLGLNLCQGGVQVEAPVEPTDVEGEETVTIRSYPSPVECTDELGPAGTSFTSVLEEMHPEYEFTFAQASCLLDDETQLVTFGHHEGHGSDPHNTIQNAGQTVALFDSNMKLLKETTGISFIPGDIVGPRIGTFNENLVEIIIDGGFASETYNLDLDDFSYSLVD